MKTTTTYLTIALALVAIGCSGGSGSSSSSTTTRNLTGSVPENSTPALVKGVDTASCQADTILATDSSGTTTQADVASDCTFSIELAVGESYAISFLNGDTFVATLIFDSGVSGTSSSIPLSSGDGTISLGSITFTGSVATPALNPLTRCDEDDDGTSDFDDSDDDNDGIDDDAEEDCDLDGHRDDMDADLSCSDSTDSAHVFEVKPRNNPHTDRGRDTVDPEQRISARIGCTVDTSTVNSTTFHVESAAGEEVECTLATESHSYGSRIVCAHDPLAADTVYTLTISGITCEDGQVVTDVTSSFLSESEDDDEGSPEDELDDSSSSDDDGNDDSEDSSDDD